MNIKEVNFQDLIYKYYEKTGASVVQPKMLSMISDDKNKLSILLRDYAFAPITEKEEIDFRQDTDELIEFYSILEIAIYTNFIEEPSVQESFWQQTYKILNNPHVIKYYSVLYPEYLAMGLCNRLVSLYNKNYNQAISVGKYPTQLVIEFFELDHIFVRGLRRSKLLKLLDSFTIQGQRISDLVAHISTPEDYLSCLYDQGKFPEVIQEATQELDMFLAFTLRLNNLQKKLNEYQGFKTVIWLRYCYWFSDTNPAFNSGMRKILKTVNEWQIDFSKVEEDLEDSISGEYNTHIEEIQSGFLGLLTKPEQINKAIRRINEIFKIIQVEQKF